MSSEHLDATRRDHDTIQREGVSFILRGLRGHPKAFLTWWATHGEDISDSASVFTGQRGPLTSSQGDD